MSYAQKWATGRNLPYLLTDHGFETALGQQNKSSSHINVYLLFFLVTTCKGLWPEHVEPCCIIQSVKKTTKRHPKMSTRQSSIVSLVSPKKVKVCLQVMVHPGLVSLLRYLLRVSPVLGAAFLFLFLLLVMIYRQNEK